jgi:hypothetical protein
MDLQVILHKNRQKSAGDLKKAQRKLKDLHQRAAAGLDVETLPGFYQEYASNVAQLGQLNELVDQLAEERKGLVAWFKLLKESDRLYTSLSTLPDLRARLTDEIVREIMHNFTRRSNQQELGELAGDAELFRLRFDEISRERDTIVAAGHEKFAEKKEEYRQWLATMGVERTDFPARYSPIEDQESYQDMIQQVRLLAVSHLDHLMERLKDIDLNLRKARRIHFDKFTDKERVTLVDLEKRRNDLQVDLETASKWLAGADLAQAEDLEERANVLAKIGATLEGVYEATWRLSPSVPPQTPEEQQVMSLLGDRREADLTELVLSAGDELNLNGMITGLVGLYQGNQVSIKVQRRGG